MVAFSLARSASSLAILTAFLILFSSSVLSAMSSLRYAVTHPQPSRSANLRILLSFLIRDTPFSIEVVAPLTSPAVINFRAWSTVSRSSSLCFIWFPIDLYTSGSSRLQRLVTKSTDLSNISFSFLFSMPSASSVAISATLRQSRW